MVFYSQLRTSQKGLLTTVLNLQFSVKALPVRARSRPFLVCELAVERLGTQDDRVLRAHDHIVIEVLAWEIEVAADSLLDLNVTGIAFQMELGESEFFAATIETDVQGAGKHLCHLFVPLYSRSAVLT